MSSITQNIEHFNEVLRPFGASLVAVSKTKPAELIMEAYEGGFKRFGENKVQELAWKAEELPEDIEWHMIGHLQRNKVKYIAPFVHLIHSVDSLRLLKEVNKQGLRNQRKINCLLQMHIAEESTKFGLSSDELWELLESEEFQAMENILVCGLMGMATNTENEDVVRKEFSYLKSLFDQLKEKQDEARVKPEILSMGMSGDFRIALEEGSTMVRVGSSIFGARN